MGADGGKGENRPVRSDKETSVTSRPSVFTRTEGSAEFLSGFNLPAMPGINGPDGIGFPAFPIVKKGAFKGMQMRGKFHWVCYVWLFWRSIPSPNIRKRKGKPGVAGVGWVLELKSVWMGNGTSRCENPDKL